MSETVIPAILHPADVDMYILQVPEAFVMVKNSQQLVAPPESHLLWLQCLLSDLSTCSLLALHGMCSFCRPSSPGSGPGGVPYAAQALERRLL
jgi:hypothetical protein